MPNLTFVRAARAALAALPLWARLRGGIPVTVPAAAPATGAALTLLAATWPLAAHAQVTVTAPLAIGAPTQAYDLKTAALLGRSADPLTMPEVGVPLGSNILSKNSRGAASASAPTTPLSRDQVLALAKRYAPIVRFHPEEQYFMCNVEWYLKRTTLHKSDGSVKASPDVADLLAGGDGKWLEVSDAVKPGDLATAKAYVHAIWKPGWDYTDIQYWFCSGYNGPGTLHVNSGGRNNNVSVAPLGEHWIDWEMVTVRVKNATQAVAKVYLSQHGDGEWITDLSQFERSGEQFVVYASKNGHANYTNPGEHPTELFDLIEGTNILKANLRNDTAPGGKEFDCARNLSPDSLVSADFLGVAEAAWLRFPERWGRGTRTSLGTTEVANLVRAALASHPIPIIEALPSPALTRLVKMITDIFVHDDTNGVYGPQTQMYWTGKLSANNGCTGITTNRTTPPCVVTFKGQFHTFFQDPGGRGVMQMTSADGITWSQPTYTGVTTTAGPYAVVYNEELYVFFRDGSGKGILHIQSTDGNKWSPAGSNWYIGLNCDGQPHAAVSGNTLCVVAVDQGGRGIMRAVQTSPNGGWNVGYTGRTTNNDTPPCIVAFKGVFYVFCKDPGGRGIMQTTSTDGINWSEFTYTGVTTTAGPAAVVLDDTLYVFFRDGDGKGILHIKSTNGKNWSPGSAGTSWYIGLNCDGQPNVAVRSDLNSGTLILTGIDADGRGIMRSLLTNW